MSLKEKLTREDLNKLNPTPGVIRPFKGKELDTGKDFAANKEDIVQVLEAVMTRHAGHFNNLGCAYAWLGKIPKAAEQFDEANAFKGGRPKYEDFGKPPHNAKAQAAENRKVLEKPKGEGAQPPFLPPSMERKVRRDLLDR